MKLFTKYMTRNDCYTANRKITPKGIMVHSTAAPGVMAAAWFDRWNKSYKAGEIGKQACVHAFVDDKEVWQYLPWNHRGWHAGGKANDTHIGFEICEPGGFKYSGGSNMVGYDVEKNQEYFEKAYANAVELCVYLCRMFNLTEKDIICHSEGYKLGVASNHGDVMHWFPKHKKSMDTFREDVKKALNSTNGGGDEMKYYKILGNEVMNLRATAPNGKIIMPIPTGTIISGNEFLTASNGTIWMKTQYNGIDGWVAVGPPSKGYCEEVPAPKPEPDYKAQYELQKARADMLELENKNLKAENERLGKEIVLLQSAYDDVIMDIRKLANKY